MWLRLWGRVRINGRECMPREGGVLVVSNHLGAGDPEILWAIFPRQLWFMALDTLFDLPVIGFLMHCAGAFPVHRGRVNRRAVQTALWLLRTGESVAMYPEGERTVRADLERPHAGVGYLALLTGVPILPVGLAGSERIFPRVRLPPKQRGIDVRIGPAFMLPEEIQDRHVASEYIMQRVADLLPTQYRGYLRDHER